MIFGNPDSFAIYVDIIEEWSYPNSKEGIFAYILNNQLIPSNCFEASLTLGVYWGDLQLLKKGLENNLRENELLFSQPIKLAYSTLEDLKINQDIWNYTTLIGDLIDNSNELYLVTWQDKARLFYQESHTKNTLIIEIDKVTLAKILDETLSWFEKNLKTR